jgi:hypothetical protein
MLLDTTKEQTTSKLEVALNILGSEVIRFSLTSESRYKNWAVFGIFVLILLAYVISSIGPDLINLYQTLNGSGA